MTFESSKAKMSRYTLKLLLTILCLSLNCRAIIMRNNALMDKMVSQFQEQNPSSPEERPQKTVTKKRQEKVMSIMQNVLCKNFPSIPCRTIIEDETLRTLIEKSIQQINYKKLSLERTTAMPGYHLTLFPIINSEELSNFLRIRDAGYYGRGKPETFKKRKQKKATSKFWQQQPHSKHTNNNKDTKRTAIYSGRKKLRKFYPHKVKYKENTEKIPKNLGASTEEKLSMSVEVPDMTLMKHHQHVSYKVKPANPPLWMIDYMKHGEPNLNGIDFGTDSLKGKLVKTGPNVIVDENILEQSARKEVLHPDVYIKTNFIRKNDDLETSDDGMK